MNKTLYDYLKIKEDYGLRGYKVFFKRGTYGRGWDLMYAPNVTNPLWEKHITWFDKNPLLTPNNIKP